MTTMTGAGICCALCPSRPNKAQQLGYKAKPGYVVNHIRVCHAEAKIYEYSAHTGDVGKFYPIYVVLCIGFFFWLFIVYEYVLKRVVVPITV